MGDTPSHVLVTGAGGQLGRRVVECLRGLGMGVTAMLHRPGDVEAERVVVGSTGDVAFVRDALDGVDAIVHCAALRAPTLGPPEVVFGGNSMGTFNVLEQGGQLGVRRAVIASSYSALGLTFALTTREPAYLPIDELVPPQVEDPYALSKQVDELIAGVMWWRHGMSVVALRLPGLGDLERTLPERAARIAANPGAGKGTREFWSYLEDRDAARACALGLTEAPPGTHVVQVTAPNTLAPYPTEQLLDFYHPTVPRRAGFPGRAAPFDLARARAILGFSAEYVLEVEERPFDPVALGLQLTGST